MVPAYPYDDDEELRRVRFAVAQELERKKFLGLPIGRCDPNTGRIYIEYADGSTETYGYVKKDQYGSNS